MQHRFVVFEILHRRRHLRLQRNGLLRGCGCVRDFACCDVEMCDVGGDEVQGSLYHAALVEPSTG